MNNVHFQKWDCTVSVQKARNGNTVLQLFDEEGPVATATVQLNNIRLPRDMAYIKDYSENEGMLDALIKAGIVLSIVAWRPVGYARAALCHLNLN
jgi:hypothetical protein